MLVTFLTLRTPSMLFSGLITPLSSLDPAARVISRLIHFAGVVREKPEGIALTGGASSAGSRRGHREAGVRGADRRKTTGFARTLKARDRN
jgi:hypothetical protein